MLSRVQGGKTKHNFKLLYKMSVHGKTSQNFHKQVDGHSQTVFLIKTKENKKKGILSNVFGGYTSLEWRSKGFYKADP